MGHTKPASGSFFLPFFGVASPASGVGTEVWDGSSKNSTSALKTSPGRVRAKTAAAHTSTARTAPRTMTSRRRYQRGRSDDTPWRLARRQDAPVDLLARLGRPPAVAALDGEDAVYVVGGAVRDLLLDGTPHELDFVVEGDAVAVARRAAARAGGEVLVHDRFGTATVTTPEATFDLAGARRERYERPGALPEVELGASLREDLERRDFTVNAIALHLSDGELTWLPGAEEDLRAGRLRVLHDESFRDDPTRLLRLARYAARLGFEPEERTDRLAAEAVAGGAVQTITGSRMGAELRLLLQEPPAGGAARARAPRARAGAARRGLRARRGQRSRPPTSCGPADSPRSPRR